MSESDDQTKFIQSDTYRGMTDMIDEINHISPLAAKALKHIKRIMVNKYHDDQAMLKEVEGYARDLRLCNPKGES